MSELLTIQEAAKILHTPVGTLRYWRLQGQGPVSAQLGRRIFYRRSDLEAFIDAAFEQGKANLRAGA